MRLNTFSSEIKYKATTWRRIKIYGKNAGQHCILIVGADPYEETAEERNKAHDKYEVFKRLPATQLKSRIVAHNRAHQNAKVDI